VWIVLAAALVLMDVSAGRDRATRDASDRHTQLLPLPDGKPLVIEITIGAVRIEGWDRPEAEITVERRAPNASLLSRVPVQIAEVPPGVVVRALQADHATDPAIRSDVTVRLPRSATIERVQVMEGRIDIVGFSGAITGDIRRGPIEGKDITGTVRLESGIGSVTLTNARLMPNGLLRLRVFNGNVTLSLAERPLDARITALALNGSIASEIPLTLRDTWGPRWGETTIGKGEPVIAIDVVTGRVEIKSPSRR
jgi:hypothetical protein